MSDTIPYIQTDEHGVLRVGASRVMIDSIVAGFQRGQSAESIQEQYPAVSLEEVYGAIAYYLGHQAEVDEYLAGQQQTWSQQRQQSQNTSGPVVQRLRALRISES